MNNSDFLNNFTDAACVFSSTGELLFKNKQFLSTFPKIKSFERLKKHFNFNVCILSSENIQNSTPLDFVLKSNEPFHTVCTYQNENDEYEFFYIYSFWFNKQKIIIFKNITAENKLRYLENENSALAKKLKETNESKNKLGKLQEHAQLQVLKMAIINRISLVIRETNNISAILNSALKEIEYLLGGYMTCFLVCEENVYKIKYSTNNTTEINKTVFFDDNTLSRISKKEIFVSSCLKEFINSENFLPKGVNRIIIPVYNKDNPVGIIVSFTKHKIEPSDNEEILQSIAVQLASSIINAELIEQLNNKNNELEKTLTELKETQIQLINSEKMATVGQLVSGVAHEINTPLASISSNNKMINKIISQSETPSKTQIDIIRELNCLDIEAAQRISDIVKSLKRFIRLDEAEFQEADINKELDLTLKLTAHEMKNNIKVVKNYGDIPPVLCCVNMLNQVFMNLIVNACHSIQEKNEPGIITVSTKIENGNLIVGIKDNGKGIPEEVQNKIFNVGFTTKKIGIGTGLGLAICKKITEIHKGTISFNSKEGIGTEFIICIPV